MPPILQFCDPGWDALSTLDDGFGFVLDRRFRNGRFGAD
jgi:hypothetical protein